MVLLSTPSSSLCSFWFHHCLNALEPIIRSCLVSSMTQMQLFGALHIAICCNCVPAMIVMKMNALFLPHDELDNTTNTNTHWRQCIIKSCLAALEVFCLPFNWNEDDYGVMVYFFHVMWLQRSWLIAVIVIIWCGEFLLLLLFFYACECDCEWHIVWHSKPRIIVEAIWNRQ